MAWIEVRLAQAHPAVQEQGVVGNAGVFRHLQRGRAGQLVGLAGDEVLEGQVGVRARAFVDDVGGIGIDRRAPPRPRAAARGLRRTAQRRPPARTPTGAPASATARRPRRPGQPRGATGMRGAAVPGAGVRRLHLDRPLPHNSAGQRFYLAGRSSCAPNPV